MPSTTNMMMFQKKKWNQPEKSKTMKSECPENLIQGAVEEYLTWNKIDYIRIPDGVFKWIKLNTPKWFQLFFFKTFGGRPDLTIIKPIGNGIAVSLLMELKTQDSKGRAVGKLHGKQKHHKDEWIICRSVDSAINEIKKFEEKVKKMKKVLREDIN
jgi:hypothetical protein